MTFVVPLPGQPLKPCPFCGRTPHLTQVTEEGRWVVECTAKSCAVNPRTRVYQFRPLASRGWNRRLEVAP